MASGDVTATSCRRRTTKSCGATSRHRSSPSRLRYRATARWRARPSPWIRWPAAATCAAWRPWSTSCSTARPSGCRSSPSRDASGGSRMRIGFIGLGAMGLPMAGHLVCRRPRRDRGLAQPGPDRCRGGAGGDRRGIAEQGRRGVGGDVPLRPQLPGSDRGRRRDGAGARRRQDGGRLLHHRSRGGAGPARPGRGDRSPLPRRAPVRRHGRRAEGHADADGGWRCRRARRDSSRPWSPSPGSSSTSGDLAWVRSSSCATTSSTPRR